jgi:HD-like signal output (HDOD) protein
MTGASAKADPVVEQLLASMAAKGDFPALSRSVKEVVSALRECEDQKLSRLVNIVLSDFALTQRVLRLANSAMYASFGGNVTTVSHAVLLLGHDTVAHLALGLKLLDGLGGSTEYPQSAQEEMSCTLVASAVARTVAATAGAKTNDAELAVICTLMINLGRLLVSFYLPQAWQAVQARAAADGCSEEAVAAKVLGVTLESIGIRIARHWLLPGAICEVMQHAGRESGRRPLEHVPWLAAVAKFSSSAARTVCRPNAEQEMARLTKTYGPLLGQDPAQLSQAVEAALAQAPEVEHLRRIVPAVSAPARGKPLDSLARLRNGLAELKRVPGGLAELLATAAEMVYRAMGFSRVAVFVHEPARRLMRVRLAFGDGADDLVNSLQFDEAFAPDVFHLALSQNLPIFIENAADDKAVQRLPAWHRERFPDARSFLLMPVVLNNKPLALLYGEWSHSLAHFVVTKDELSALVALRTTVLDRLRNTAAMAPCYNFQQ